MSYEVDFKEVSTVGLESSPVVDALAGLRANEARYFKNKYDHVFTVEPASKAKKIVAASVSSVPSTVSTTVSRAAQYGSSQKALWVMAGRSQESRRGMPACAGS